MFRVRSQQWAYIHAGDENREDEGKREEPGVLKGLMPCVLGVFGVSLFCWALFFFIVPPEVYTGTSEYLADISV